MRHQLLIAEAERDLCDRLSVAAREAGWEVTALDAGADLLRQADLLLPSAIVLAGDLDRNRGFGLCNLLKRHPVLKHVPLVLTLAGEDAPAILEQHARLQTRAEVYLPRPYAPADLLARLEPLLGAPRQEQLARLMRIRETAPPPSNLRSALLWLVLVLALVLTGVLYWAWSK